MKRTIEYTLLIIGAVISLIGIAFTIIIKFVAKTPEFKSEFEVSFNEEMQRTQDLSSSVTADQVLNSLGGIIIYALIILAISLLLTIVAIIFVKKQRVLSGVLAIVAGLISILILNFISSFLLILAGIMLLIRKNKLNNQFEDVNFENDLNNHQNNFGSNDKQLNSIDETDKKKKDDDPYIY